MNPKDIALAEEWASIYRMRGFQPLPSSPDKKKPLCRFAHWWESKAPDDLFKRFPTSQIQVMTGIYWRLLIIDLDGEDAKKRWDRMGRTPRTWITHREGGNSHHIWFKIPQWVSGPLPTGFVWRGKEDHSGIERLCDHALVTVPPSRYVKDNRLRYRFLDHAHSPFGLGIPANAPRWVLDLEILRLRPVAIEDQIVSNPVSWNHSRRVATPASIRMDRDEVIRSINPIAIAREWGIRFDGKPTQKGWVPCKAFNREDKIPSAAIHRATGVYVDRGSGLTLSFFDLAVSIAGFKDWIEAKDALAQGRTRP